MKKRNTSLLQWWNVPRLQGHKGEDIMCGMQVFTVQHESCRLLVRYIDLSVDRSIKLYNYFILHYCAYFCCLNILERYGVARTVRPTKNEHIGMRSSSTQSQPLPRHDDTSVAMIHTRHLKCSKMDYASMFHVAVVVS